MASRYSSITSSACPPVRPEALPEIAHRVALIVAHFIAIQAEPRHPEQAAEFCERIARAIPRTEPAEVGGPQRMALERMGGGGSIRDAHGAEPRELVLDRLGDVSFLEREPAARQQRADVLPPSSASDRRGQTAGFF